MTALKDHHRDVLDRINEFRSRHLLVKMFRHWRTIQTKKIMENDQLLISREKLDRKKRRRYFKVTLYSVRYRKGLKKWMKTWNLKMHKKTKESFLEASLLKRLLLEKWLGRWKVSARKGTKGISDLPRSN